MIALQGIFLTEGTQEGRGLQQQQAPPHEADRSHIIHLPSDLFPHHKGFKTWNLRGP